MEGLRNCGIYFVLTGMLGFLVGRMVPKHWFCYDRFPYRSFAFEQGGKLYDKLNVKKWLAKVPDMSRIFAGMPAKKITGKPTQESLSIMIQETCVAECIHGILNATGLGCFLIWDSSWCGPLYGVYVLLGNLPYIIIQRYTRPRLVRILRRCEAKQKGETKCVC